jgi:nucleoside-diphosphate-sugar epimerase
VYGPRAKENHAVLAMIARAYLRQEPFEVWGTGEQVRNWTYVDDIVAGTLLAAERISDGSAVNLGTMERIRVREAAALICERFGYRPAVVPRPEMPSGPTNRVADNSLAGRLLGWKPAVSFGEGVGRTIEWYRAHRSPEQVRRVLESGGLVERGISA